MRLYVVAVKYPNSNFGWQLEFRLHETVDEATERCRTGKDTDGLERQIFSLNGIEEANSPASPVVPEAEWRALLGCVHALEKIRPLESEAEGAEEERIDAISDLAAQALAAVEQARRRTGRG